MLQSQMQHFCTLIEEYLNHLFTQTVAWNRLYEAMRYSVCAGGKRVRPVLTMLFCEACGDDAKQALPFGCAVELVHTYSLIHDDMPCMDDDDLRRGKPTNHKCFGEAGALLAGDALQAAAFELILSSEFSSDVRAKAALELARCVGADGMCAGQQLDIQGETHALTIDALRLVHAKKTGALLRCACVLGVIAAGGSDQQIAAARDYAAEIGMAFQIRDDMLDQISTTQALGKTIGSDIRKKKTTFYSLLGRTGCETEINACTKRAIAVAQANFSDCSALCDMANWLAGRMN